MDPVLGPVVLIGEGGTLLELRRDVALLHAPFSAAQAKEACRRLRLAPLFDGYRGAAPQDLDALAASVAALGRFAAAHRDEFVSVDVNPVIVLPAGHSAVAVDAVVELR